MSLTLPQASSSQATGIIIDSLNTSSLLYEISLLKSNPQRPLCLFYMNNGINDYKFRFGVFPLLSVHQLKQYPGSLKPTLIATSLESAKLLINLRQPVKKIFYVYSLEWYNNSARKNYDTNVKILNNKQLRVITRHESYRKAIEDYCGLYVPVTSLQKVYDL